MNICNITADELANALQIEKNHLFEICDFFDANPDDEWELVEGVHFKWELYNSRLFSPCGSFEICKYLEERDSRSVYKRFQRWLLQRDARLKALMVAKQVEASSKIPGQLIFQNGTAFLGPRACRQIFGLGTRQDVLNKSFTEIQRRKAVEIEPLEINEDFLTNDDDERFLSRTGLSVTGKHLGGSIKSKHRQDWLKAVEKAAPRALARIEADEADRESRIENAVKRVKNRAKGCCSLTGRTRRKNRIDLSVHHLFDKHTYPELADREDNLIAIDQDVHRHFHMWMGGTNISCTIMDLENYIEQFHDSLFPGEDIDQATDAAILLSRSKDMLLPRVEKASKRN